MGFSKSGVARSAGRRNLPFHECTNSCGSSVPTIMPASGEISARSGRRLSLDS